MIFRNGVMEMKCTSIHNVQDPAGKETLEEQNRTPFSYYCLHFIGKRGILFKSRWWWSCHLSQPFRRNLIGRKRFVMMILRVINGMRKFFASLSF